MTQFLLTKTPKKTILILVLSLFLIACNSEYKRLEKYFQANTGLHKELSDSLVAFCRKGKTDVILRKSSYNERAISFQLLFKTENTYYPVYFDSALNRHDPNPGKTLNFEIPLKTIKRFNEIAYTSVSGDSTQTFFGGAWHVKLQLGTQGDSQYGILMSADTSIYKRCFKRLSANACLTEGTIP